MAPDVRQGGQSDAGGVRRPGPIPLDHLSQGRPRSQQQNRPASIPADHVAGARPHSQQESRATRQRRPPQQEHSHLGSEVAAAVSSSTGVPRQLPRSRAAAAALANAGAEHSVSQVVAAARKALADAREMHKKGRDEEAVDMLVEWLDGPPADPRDAEMQELLQAMVALGCWLCNTLATRHLHARRVARAFGYTTTCERWLALRRIGKDDSGSEEMWARLQYDRALNAAELAQSSGDRPKAIWLLRECEHLQVAVPSLPDPEATHLCLAEVLLQSGRYAEAVTAAVRATQLLRKQAVDDEERKIYGLLFAISLEQAALCAMGATAGSGPPPLRALRCLADAEAAWALVKPASEGEPSPGIEAARALLMEMRAVHEKILQQAQAAHNVALSTAQAKAKSKKAKEDMPPSQSLSSLVLGQHSPGQSRHGKSHQSEKPRRFKGAGSPAKKHNMSDGERQVTWRKGAMRHKELCSDTRHLQDQMRYSTMHTEMTCNTPPPEPEDAPTGLAGGLAAALAGGLLGAARPKIQKSVTERLADATESCILQKTQTAVLHRLSQHSPGMFSDLDVSELPMSKAKTMPALTPVLSRSSSGSKMAGMAGHRNTSKVQSAGPDALEALAGTP